MKSRLCVSYLKRSMKCSK